MGSSSHLTKHDMGKLRAALFPVGLFEPRWSSMRLAQRRLSPRHRKSGRLHTRLNHPECHAFLIVSLHMPMAPNDSRFFAQGPGTLHTIYSESRFGARGQLLVRAQKALRPMEETNVGPLNRASFRRVALQPTTKRNYSLEV